MPLPAEELRERLAGSAVESAVAHGMLVLVVAKADLVALVRRLKSELGFDMLLDVTAVDWPQRLPRFELVYHFYSTRELVRVRVKTHVAEDDAVIDSLAPLYSAARILERECHDMYGIVFYGHGDLRRVLLYEAFVGHPLRKDYPKDREQPLVPYRE